MEQRKFGNTGLDVSILGLGAGHIGTDTFSEKEYEDLLNQALDLGITLIDTARAYGKSEERIGRYLSGRRKEFVISTKVGYGIPGYEDWTYGCIRAGIDEALKLMRTDYLDVVHLHSCPVGTLEHGEVLRALEEGVSSGKIRVAGYSGENEALNWAIDSGRFGDVEHSINLCDQRALWTTLPKEREKNMGVIAKRPVANAPWRFAECPVSHYAEEYWWRWKTMEIDPRGLPWQEIALRFAAFTPGVHSCIVGTSNIDHLKQNVSFLEKGPLPVDFYDTITTAFKNNDPGWWTGQV
ncbi:MAG TPA: aldo/keto reductase [Bacteroidota bacterium]|nr:aldo/keto reductase [Bacteroidota bacterium]